MADDQIEIVVLRLPTEVRADLVGGRDNGRRITGTAHRN